MTNTNNNNTEERSIFTIKTALSTYARLTLSPDAKNSELVNAKTALEQALQTYNDETLSLAYTNFDASADPLQTLARRATWDKAYPRIHKDGTTEVVFRATRFDVLSYLEHVAERRADDPTISIALPASLDTIKDALKKASEALSAYVLFSINHDTEGVSIKNTAATIYNYARLYNVDSLRVRPADVRYLAMVVTRAGELGEVRTIKPESVARYLLDAIHVQSIGQNYMLESKKTEKK